MLDGGFEACGVLTEVLAELIDDVGHTLSAIGVGVTEAYAVAILAVVQRRLGQTESLQLVKCEAIAVDGEHCSDNEAMFDYRAPKCDQLQRIDLK